MDWLKVGKSYTKPPKPEKKAKTLEPYNDEKEKKRELKKIMKQDTKMELQLYKNQSNENDALIN
jgi:hypothetical protein